MMDAPDGKTMSKTRGNGINMGDSAEDMYGKAMSYPDRLIPCGLELLTDIPLAQIAEIQSAMQRGDNPMPYKKMMAFEIVKSIKGAAMAERGQRYFEKTVQRKELPDDIETRRVLQREWSVVELVAELGLTSSRSETRRLIQGGGVKMAGQRVSDPHSRLTLDQPVILQVGRRKIVRVSFE